MKKVKLLILVTLKENDTLKIKPKDEHGIISLSWFGYHVSHRRSDYDDLVARIATKSMYTCEVKTFINNIKTVIGDRECRVSFSYVGVWESHKTTLDELETLFDED